MDNIIKNIEAIRKEKEIKQIIIAEALGISQSSYSQLLTRNKDIKYQRLLDIANIFEIPVIDIITYPEKYVIKTEILSCSECKKKDKVIEQLSNYIDIIQGGQKKTKSYKVANS